MTQLTVELITMMLGAFRFHHNKREKKSAFEWQCHSDDKRNCCVGHTVNHLINFIFEATKNNEQFR